MSRLARNLALILAFITSMGTAAGLHAQEKFPSRPVRIIVPFTAGGVGDILARVIAGQLTEGLGQSVVVENRPGADAATGTEYAAKAAPDGYTILQVATTQIVNMALKPDLRYDLLRDFTPVVRVADVPLVLITPATAPTRSVAELVAYAKSKPGGIVFGTGGNGSIGHLAAELFNRSAGISALHVPFKGNSLVVTELMGGRLDFAFATPPEAVANVKAGLLRALAVTSTQRIAALPDVPTMIELGFPGFDPMARFGYAVPKGTPAPIVHQLELAFRKAMASPVVLERLPTLGMTAGVGGPDQLTAMIKAEIARWGPIIKAANIRAE